jgi:hypothetical protein
MVMEQLCIERRSTAGPSQTTSCLRALDRRCGVRLPAGPVAALPTCARLLRLLQCFHGALCARRRSQPRSTSQHGAVHHGWRVLSVSRFGCRASSGRGHDAASRTASVYALLHFSSVARLQPCRATDTQGRVHSAQCTVHTGQTQAGALPPKSTHSALEHAVRCRPL